MPRGGARPGSGPAKDPKSLRSMKLAERNGKKILPSTFAGALPEWPLTYASARASEVWELYWKKPQAHLWAIQGSEFEVAIHVQTLCEAEVPNVQTSTRTLLLQQMNSLMLTEASLSKAGYAIDDGDTLAVKKPATRTTSSRARLRAVPDVGPTS